MESNILFKNEFKISENKCFFPFQRYITLRYYSNKNLWILILYIRTEVSYSRYFFGRERFMQITAYASDTNFIVILKCEIAYF